MGDLPNMGEIPVILQEETITIRESALHPLALHNAKENSNQPKLIKLLKPSTNSVLEKRLEKKLLHKDEKLHELRNRCAHLLKVEKRCNDLHNELNLKKEHIEVLTKNQACMQQQLDNTERKHTEDLTLLVRALEKSKVDLGSQAQLIEILVRDLQTMKSTLEYCKDELLIKDERVSVLEEDLRKAKHSQNERNNNSKVGSTTASKLHRAHALGGQQQASKRKYMKPRWQPLPITVNDPEQCMDSWQKEKSELQATVAKLTREGELWKFEKAMLVSALHAAKKEFSHQHEKLNILQEILRKTTTPNNKSTSSTRSGTCETPHCNSVVEKHRHHCAVCRKKEERKALQEAGTTTDQSSNHVIRSLGEQLRKQMQLHYDLEEKLRSTKKQLSQSHKKLKTTERDRAEVADQLAHACLRNYDMDCQMSLLHDSLLGSSARLEHVTSQLRESCHQKVSVQKSLECSLVSLQEASVDVVLENSAKELEFKSMKLLQRLMATRLRWGHTIATDYQLLIEH